MTNIEYPENREWKQKAFGMPKLPSGDMGQDKVLYYILKMVKDGKSANTMLNIEGSNSTATLGRMCEWIRPIGLVNKEKQVWTLTELGEMVLERQDSYFSTAVFCSTIVFMGEILFYLQEPKNSQELLKIAEEYHLNWKTNSEIHNRIKWFRDVDMVRFKEYKLEYSLTQKGQEFLQQIEVTMPSETEEEPDETLLETQLPMSEWASALKPATTEKKRMAIGYMPGKTADACITISAYLIDVDTLEQLIRNQVEIPLTGEDYKKIFEQTGIVDISVLDEARNRTERYGLLVDAIVGCLVNESKDEVTEGILTSREIYRTVRDDERFSINPNLDEIEDILKFLASPLIGCVGKNKDGYYAIGSLNEVAKKFQFYAKSCKKTS